jgi:hypothetical protein
LIVIGRSSAIQQAKALSASMAGALVRSLYSQGHLPFFTVFDAPQSAPAGERISRAVLVAMGGGVALLLGMAFAVFHYQARRPVLTTDRASRLVKADHVTSVRGKRPAWLGALRGSPPWRDSTGNRKRLARLGQGIGRHRLWVELPDRRERRGDDADRLSTILGIPLSAPIAGRGPSRDGLTIVVCGPSTAEPDLLMAGLPSRDGAAGSKGWMELLWVR